MPVTNLFGTSGVRGTDQEINEVFGEKLGQAFGKYLGKNKLIAIGRDNRPGADKLSAAVKKGLEKQGIKVTDYGVLPTPELAFHLTRTKANGGVMITGSHLPIGMIGIIPMLNDGSGVYGKIGEKITSLFYEQ